MSVLERAGLRRQIVPPKAVPLADGSGRTRILTSEWTGKGKLAGVTLGALSTVGVVLGAREFLPEDGSGVPLGASPSPTAEITPEITATTLPSATALAEVATITPAVTQTLIAEPTEPTVRTSTPRPTATPTVEPLDKLTPEPTIHPTQTLVSISLGEIPTPRLRPTATETAATPTVETMEVSLVEGGNQIDKIVIDPNAEDKTFITEGGTVYIVTGDVTVGGEELFDRGNDSGKTGLTVGIIQTETEITAPFGATIRVYDSAPSAERLVNLLQDQFENGCERGCESITFYLKTLDGEKSITITQKQLEDVESLQLDLVAFFATPAESFDESTGNATPLATRNVQLPEAPEAEPTSTPRLVAAESTATIEPTEEPTIETTATAAPTEEPTSTPVEDVIAPTAEPLPLEKTEVGPGETITITGPAIVSGDVFINGVQQFDSGFEGTQETGYVAYVQEGVTVEVSQPEWGWSYYQVTGELSDIQMRKFLKQERINGCDHADGDGCDTVQVDVFSEEGETASIVLDEETMRYYKLSEYIPLEN